MEMKTEALELLQHTAQLAQKAEVIEVPNEKRLFFVRIGDQIHSLKSPPAVRAHLLDSLADVVTLAIATAQIEGSQPVVWHSRSKVQLIYDDSDRRDCATMLLHASREHETLAALDASACNYSQDKLIRMLRFELGVDSVRLATFRRLNWQSNDGLRREIDHGVSGLGKEVLARLDNSDDLPDEMTFRVPLYDVPGERALYSVRCGIEIDTVNREFILQLLPGELSVAEEAARNDIHERLLGALSKAATGLADDIRVLSGTAF